MRVAFSGLAPRAEPLRACVRPPSARAGLAVPAPTDAGLTDPAPTGRPEPGRDVGAGSVRPASVGAGTARPARAEGGLTQARSGSARGANPLKATRMAYFAEAGGFVETPVYDRDALGPGARCTGPAIVEERESTAVVGPGGGRPGGDRPAPIVGGPSLTRSGPQKRTRGHP